MDALLGKKIFGQIRAEIEQERRERRETWETPLVAYLIAALCETFGPLKSVIKEVLQMSGAVSSVVVPRLRSAFENTLPQYKMRAGLKKLSAAYESYENFRYVKIALMTPSKLLKRQSSIINELNRLFNERKGKITRYSELASTNLFLTYFLPFVLLYSLLLLGKVMFLPFIPLIQLGIYYVTRKKLFYALS